MKTIIKPIRNLPTTNFINGKKYYISSFNTPLPEAQLNKMVEICNQTHIYKILFKDMLENKPYTIKNAKDFQQYSIEGWKNQNRYVFIIKDSTDQITSCMDIKQSSPIAEIGYWSSVKHPGIMTNSVNQLIKVAKRSGYKSLYARIIPTNQKSINLIKRIGFKYSTRVKYKHEQTLHHKYILTL